MRAMRGWWIVVCALAGCAHAGPALPPGAAGRLLYVLDGDSGRRLFVAGTAGSRQVPGVAPREARWVDGESILVVEELTPAEEFGLPRTQLRIVDLAGNTLATIGEPGQHYDAEPSPDGAWLAVGVDAQGTGDSDLEIWQLSPPHERVALRRQSFEEPRWRYDGMALVASVLMPDPETDDDLGGGMLGTSFQWPRLHVVRRDLGDPTLLWDGADAGRLAPGGSLPLWWDEDGIFARQRQGLVRCDPVAGGCVTIHRTEPSRRVVDGRRVGLHEAWLVTVEARDAFDRSPPDELRRVDLRDGRLLSRWRTPRGEAVTEIDWSP